MKKDNNMLASNDIEFLSREIWARLNKNKIINAIKQKDMETTKYLLEHGISLFPCYGLSDVTDNDVKVMKDVEVGLFYADYKGKRIYLKRKYRSAYRAKRYFNNIMFEQLEKSPHRYLTDDFAPEYGDIVLDIGGAEGIFAIDYIDKIAKLYIFECDTQWIDALQITYKDYMDKVVIVDKMVSDYDDDTHITIDSFVKMHNLQNEKLFIKVDAEASERLILKGGASYLSTCKNCSMVICTYHKADDENIVRIALSDWKIEASAGYMLYYYDYEIKPPYLRKGVLRCRKK